MNYGTLAILNVNSYGKTQIWYAASFVVDNLFVGIGYVFIYLHWTAALVFLCFFFFSFLQLDHLLISFEEMMLFHILNPKLLSFAPFAEKYWNCLTGNLRAIGDFREFRQHYHDTILRLKM